MSRYGSLSEIILSSVAFRRVSFDILINRGALPHKSFKRRINEPHVRMTVSGIAVAEWTLVLGEYELKWTHAGSRAGRGAQRAVTRYFGFFGAGPFPKGRLESAGLLFMGSGPLGSGFPVTGLRGGPSLTVGTALGFLGLSSGPGLGGADGSPRVGAGILE